MIVGAAFAVLLALLLGLAAGGASPFAGSLVAPGSGAPASAVETVLVDIGFAVRAGGTFGGFGALVDAGGAAALAVVEGAGSGTSSDLSAVRTRSIPVIATAMTPSTM